MERRIPIRRHSTEHGEPLEHRGTTKPEYKPYGKADSNPPPLSMPGEARPA